MALPSWLLVVLKAVDKLLDIIIAAISVERSEDETNPND